MATVNATQYAPPARTIEKGQFVAASFYTTASTATSTVIQMCKIAAGTTVLNVELVNAALGGSTTASVGDTANSTTYYHSGVSTASQARTRGTALPFTYASDDVITITTGGATMTGVIGVVVTMTRDNVTLA